MKQTSSPQAEFLRKLQAEAQLQAKISKTRFFPAQLDELTSFIGQYPWQVILVVSAITAGFLEAWKWV